jgi:putative ABC transport system permease protein
MDRLEARILEENPEVERGWGVTLVPLLEQRVGEVRPALLVLLGAVALLLLAACVNVANLLLARGAARTGESAVRSALGAGRARLVRQLLTESLLLALAGGALGALLAWLGLEALRTSLPGEIPRLAEAAVDGRVLAFALLLSTLTGLAFGALPALGDSRARPGAALGSRSASGAGGDAGSGGGGPAVGILLDADSSFSGDNTFNLGTPGAGGVRAGAADGTMGADGLQANTHTLGG